MSQGHKCVDVCDKQRTGTHFSPNSLNLLTCVELIVLMDNWSFGTLTLAYWASCWIQKRSAKMPQCDWTGPLRPDLVGPTRQVTMMHSWKIHWPVM